MNAVEAPDLAPRPDAAAVTSDGVSHGAGRDLPRLTSLRMFAALSVFGFHLQKWDVWAPGRVFAAGYAGVAFFFVLSGFVLTWTWRFGQPWRWFYWRRFARIYPNHLAVLLVALVVPVVAVNRGGAVATPLNALLLQAWTATDRFVYSLNGVTWSLSCEVAFYASLPLLLAVLVPRPRGQRWALAAAYFAACSLVVIQGKLGVNPVVRGGEFVLGVVVALDLREGRRLRIPLSVPLALLVLAGLAGRNLTGSTADIPVAMVTALVLAVAATWDLADRRGVLGHRALIYAGQVSFAFYLVHELVIVNLHLKAGLDGSGGALVMLLAAAAAAVVLHELVELPAQRRLVASARQRLTLAARRSSAPS